MAQNRMVAIFTVFLAFILFLILQPGDDPLAITRVASIAAGVVIVVFLIYTHFLWKVEPFRRLHKIVDINGRWEGKFFTGTKDILIEVRIRQNFDDVSVVLTTDHNYSQSLVTKISFEAEGNKLYIIYKCKPVEGVTSKDDIDYGTMILRLDEDILEGEYFNSKHLSGHLELFRKE